VTDRGDDPIALLADGAGKLDECRQPAAARPHQPTVQQPLGDRRGEPVDLAQLLLEQIRAIQPGVGLLDRGELDGLAVGEVLGVLPHRKPGALQLTRELQVALPAGFV